MTPQTASDNLFGLESPETGTAVRVLVDDLTSKALDYAVPSGWRGVASPGCRVRVPVAKQSRLGTILEILDNASTDGLKPIFEVCDDAPVFTPGLLRLGKWVSDYYCCSLAATMRCMLPQAIRKGETGFLQRQTAEATPLANDAAFQLLTHRAPRQASILEVLRRGTGPLPVAALLREASAGRDALMQLSKKGFVKLDNATQMRDPDRGEIFVHSAPLDLNPGQQAALDLIQAACDAPDANPKPILLYGVTGSGKTEVYLRAIEHVLRDGRDALVLVPEIALTPQTVERFKSRFLNTPYPVAVLHSHLSEGERHDEWHRIRRGEARIVIGARSAIFAPLKKPGLIVVDEEHETSYKQEEAPRYHARDVSVVRGMLEKCAVVLGSATPSLESTHNARTGKYTEIRLPTRIEDRSMPLIRVLDMRVERSRSKGAEIIIASKLRDALEDRLSKKEQSLLFLNRRGFSTSMLCGKCGFVARCENCSVSMTYHRAENRLICHLCGHAIKAPKICPECGDPAIRLPGVGTERVEAAIDRLFPKAVVRRMDADTMSRRDALRETLLEFRSGKIDILVGTQMIAKGLHFPNVTLVGIINADLSLHLPDFRSGERTFQLLTQVAGRAGRGDLLGEVFIQSATPFAPAIQFARHHDFDGFLEQELEFRRVCGHPPFIHLILIGVRAPHQDLARLTAETVHRRLDGELPDGTLLFEAVPAPIERLKKAWRFQIMIRTGKALATGRAIRRVLDALPMPEEVHITIDVDPYQLM